MTRLTAHFMHNSLMSDLVICKFRKAWSYMTPNVLAETRFHNTNTTQTLSPPAQVAEVQYLCPGHMQFVSIVERGMVDLGPMHLVILTLTVLVTTIDALGHFETG